MTSDASGITRGPPRPAVVGHDHHRRFTGWNGVEQAGHETVSRASSAS